MAARTNSGDYECETARVLSRLEGERRGRLDTAGGVRRKQPVARHAYSKAEVAEALGVSTDYVGDHVWPELRKVRRGRLSFVPVSVLDRWLEQEATLDL